VGGGGGGGGYQTLIKRFSLVCIRMVAFERGLTNLYQTLPNLDQTQSNRWCKIKPEIKLLSNLYVYRQVEARVPLLGLLGNARRRLQGAGIHDNDILLDGERQPADNITAVEQAQSRQT